MKILKYMKPHLLFAVLAPVLMLTEVFSELQLPNIMSDVIDYGVSNGDVNYIIRKGFLMLLIAFIGAVGGIGSAYFASKASVYFSTDVRMAMFKKIQNFSFVNLDTVRTSSLITRLTNDVNKIQQVVMMCIRMLFRSPFLFLGGMIMAFKISPKLTGIVFLAIIVMFILVFYVFKKALPLFNNVQKKVDNINTIMRENLSGVRVIKAFVRGGKEKEKFDNSNNDLRDANMTAFKTMSLMFPFMTIILNFSMIGVLYFGGIDVGRGNFSAGDLMAYITYLTQILMSLLMSSMVIMNISRGKASFDRIQNIMDIEVDIYNKENPVTKLENWDIEYKDVCFRYPDSTGDYVLEDSSIKIKQGESVGILGETGSGKTTFINLINRMYDVTEGEVLINGVNVKDIEIEYLRKNIGVCLQKAILFSGTIKDNLLWGNENASNVDIDKALKISNAYDFVYNMSENINTELGQMAVNLSGGQKQRLSIARTLLKEPKILIFDDSTSAVDVTTENQIRKELLQFMPNVTKIIIAQKISSVMHLDKIIVLSEGKIVDVGTHNELLNSSEIYQDIYKSQIVEEDD